MLLIELSQFSYSQVNSLPDGLCLQSQVPLLPPNVSPSGSKSPKMPVQPPLKAFPPPPPNEGLYKLNFL